MDRVPVVVVAHRRQRLAGGAGFSGAHPDCRLLPVAGLGLAG